MVQESREASAARRAMLTAKDKVTGYARELESRLARGAPADAELQRLYQAAVVDYAALLAKYQSFRMGG